MSIGEGKDLGNQGNLPGERGSGDGPNGRCFRVRDRQFSQRATWILSDEGWEPSSVFWGFICLEAW